ncbi:MAG: hypothetical protein AB1424_10845 [Thermodesulfobacteriota bacterium]
MEEVTLYDLPGCHFSTDPKNHQVNDISRARKRYINEIIPKLAISFGLLLLIIIFFVNLYYSVRFSHEPKWIGNYLNIIIFIVVLLSISYGFHYFGKYHRGGSLYLPWHDPVFSSFIFKIIWGLFATHIYGIIIYLNGLLYLLIFPQSLKSPTKAVNSFLKSIKLGLFERSYNILTDNAQKLGINNPGGRYQFRDLKTFREFWLGTNFFWGSGVDHRQWSSFSFLHKFLDDCTALVEAFINFNGGRGVAKFLVVQREGIWFLVNGFFCPTTNSELSHEQAKTGNSCPQCNSDMLMAYIEDGGLGDWCMNCKKSLKKMRGEL